LSVHTSTSILVVDEFEDDRFELFLGHLSMPNADASVGRQPADELSNREDGFDRLWTKKTWPLR